MPRGVSPLDEARLQGRLFSIRALRPSHWYSLNRGGGVEISIGISSLEDISGNGRTLSQATGTVQPSYVANAWLQFAAARFDGSNDVMTASAATGITNTTQFLVGKINAGGANEDLMLGYGQAAETSRGRWLYRTANGTRLGFACWATDLPQSASTVLDIGGDYHVWAVRQTGNSLILSVDGAEETNTVVGTPLATITPIWQLGGTTGNANYFTSFDVLETIAFPVALSILEYRNVIGALAWFYGLQNRMPANHPYRHRPPLIGD
jgi:hypothetical protein